MVHRIGDFLGVRDGYKIFKNVKIDESNKIYNKNKTFYTFVDDAGNAVKVIKKTVITKSDIAKGNKVVPKSSWLTTDLSTGNRVDLEYYPRAIVKNSYPTQGFGTRQQLLLSKDGKYVERYDRMSATHQAGIAYGGKTGGRYNSKDPSDSSYYEPQCKWVSLAEYNKSHPYYQLR